MKVDSDFMDKGEAFPPGFRFHPTDEELVLYYLKRKVCCKRHRLDVIGETDVYKWDPEELPGMSKLRTGDRQWFFFSPRDRKYPNGGRSNRATKHGYWKATGKDRAISCGPRTVGTKKTLIFYRGRAPSGVRTDWVMHEYTMDEEELKRCDTDKEYYALYKVYKKSGPGPKNGEQYGAPFREEDWDNDELEVQLDNPVKKADDTPCNDNKAANGQYLLPPNDLTEIVKDMEDEPFMILPKPNMAVEEGMESNFIEYSSKDSSIPAPCSYIPTANVPASFDFGQIGTNHFAPVLNVQETSATDEEFFEDFLEINDLLGICPATECSYVPDEELHFDDVDGLTESDFHDAYSILLDAGNVGTLQTHTNNFGYEAGVFDTCPDLDNLTATYQLHQQFLEVNGNSYHSVYTEEQGCGIPDQEFIPLFNPGIIPENQALDFVNHPIGATENGSKKQEDGDFGGTDSWLSSALWSFVESIPTTPASASEMVLVNRALQRMSSFSRLRLNPKNMNVEAVPSGKVSEKSSTGLMFVSCVGVLCAALWISARFLC